VHPVVTSSHRAEFLGRRVCCLLGCKSTWTIARRVAGYRYSAALVPSRWTRLCETSSPSLNFSVPVARTSQPFFNVHPYNPVINPCLQQDSLNVKSTQIERQQTIHVVCTDRWVKMQRSEVARGINYVLLSDTAAKAVDGSTVFFGNIFSMVYSPVTIWYTAVKYLHAALRTRSST
jgi:hypothetical protein